MSWLSQTGLEARVNKEAYPIQDSVQEANLIEPSLNDLQNDELNKDFEDVDLAERNREFLESRSQRIADEEEQNRLEDEQRRLAEEQRLAQEQERIRAEDENALMQLEDIRRSRVDKELSTPTKEQTEIFVPQTPRKRRNKTPSVATSMEESPSQDKLMPQIDIKKVTFTDSGLMNYSLYELKSIYTSLTGKTSNATTIIRLRNRILRENDKKSSQNEIFSRSDEGKPLKGKSLEDTPLEGKGLKKSRGKSNKKKISQPFIHFL